MSRDLHLALKDWAATDGVGALKVRVKKQNKNSNLDDGFGWLNMAGLLGKYSAKVAPLLWVRGVDSSSLTASCCAKVDIWRTTS